MRKRRVALNEYNIRLGKNCYLPLATGLLRAYVEQFDWVRARANYHFDEFLYCIDSPGNIMQHYDKPVDVAAFSVAVWNEQLNLLVAREVKRRWPRCLVVFGGLQVPDDPADYMAEHPFIDVAIRRAGEEAFGLVLMRHLVSNDFSGIPQVSYRLGDKVNVWPTNMDFKRDLNHLPSPALTGLYDGLMKKHPHEVEFSMVLESDRGCPYSCSFCEYGLGQHKMSYYGLDRVLGEIEWMGRNKIAYALGSAANFGMNKYDREIAQHLINTKQRYGYPDKFRVNYGKNTDDKIYAVAKMLSDAGMSKSVTLARQSNDQQALNNIKRSNIKMSTYANLQKRFNADGVPTYSEFILGLPGETVESWQRGLDEVIEAGMTGQVMIYPLMSLPNTDMGRAPYQKQYGIQTIRVELAEIHGTVRPADWVPEYEDLVVATNSMTVQDWRAMNIYSWVFMALHGLKLVPFDRLLWYGVKPSQVINAIIERPGLFWRKELFEYNRLLDSTLNDGAPLAMLAPEYGDVYWSPEEVTFFNAVDRGFVFDFEMIDTLKSLNAGLPVAEVIGQHRRRIPTPAHYDCDKRRFAQQVVLYGRKSGSILLNLAEECIVTVDDKGEKYRTPLNA